MTDRYPVVDDRRFKNPLRNIWRPGHRLSGAGHGSDPSSRVQRYGEPNRLCRRGAFNGPGSIADLRPSVGSFAFIAGDSGCRIEVQIVTADPQQWYKDALAVLDSVGSERDRCLPHS